jgi:DNA repair exonuclease SbcCD ATPase subunit
MSSNRENDINGFGSVLELRAYVQGELERIKEDIQSLYGVTTQLREEDARRDERVARYQNIIDDLSERVLKLNNIVERMQPLFGDGVYDIIEDELKRFRESLDNERLKRELEDARSPLTLTSLASKIKDLQDKSETNEKKLTVAIETLNVIKLKIALFASVASFVLVKGVELAIKYFTTK